MGISFDHKTMQIIDFETNQGEWKRLINIYRSFNPTHVTAKEGFTEQLNMIRNAFNKNTMLIGDFNLNENKRFDINYAHAALFETFEEKLGYLNLIQLVTFVRGQDLLEMS